jgi:glucosamine--fructose-6-phosphate aminotransferase (isomerizing)
MCGIVGYIGRRPAAPILLEALRRLEYRGYDSAGIVTIEGESFHVRKDRGKIAEIDSRLDFSSMPGRVGMAHTRWATHGEPSQRNAHPHVDSRGLVAVVHNGIIENHDELREFLQKRGFKFSSDTDTEVIPNLISFHLGRGNSLEESVARAIKRLEGSYALGIISTAEPDKLIGVRRESPLIIGVGRGEMFIASDIPALLPFTRRVVVVEDGEMVVIREDGFRITKLETGENVVRRPLAVRWSIESAEKGGFPHFTLKEIHEQPVAVRETLRMARRDLEKLAEATLEAESRYLVACGTSYHAAMVGRYVLAKLAGLPVDVVIASEFQDSCRVSEGSLVLAITQSGETADTLKAVRAAKLNGARVACLTNVVGSSITRESEIVCMTHAGPEVSVVATKTFAAQVAFLLALSIEVARRAGEISAREAEGLRRELLRIPEQIGWVLKTATRPARDLAERLKSVPDIYLIGRGIGYPVALEGALKLKEITYIHSEAMPAGELKHGTLALIEEGTPVIAVAQPGEMRRRIMSNVQEVRARGARVILLSDEKTKEAEETILLPKVGEILSPPIYIVPLQLLAYYITVARGQDPDRPRSLAKSVTVD